MSQWQQHQFDCSIHANTIPSSVAVNTTASLLRRHLVVTSRDSTNESHANPSSQRTYIYLLCTFTACCKWNTTSCSETASSRTNQTEPAIDQRQSSPCFAAPKPDPTQSSLHSHIASICQIRAQYNLPDPMLPINPRSPSVIATKSTPVWE